MVSYLNLEPATESDGAQTLAMSGMYLVVLRFNRNKALVRINSEETNVLDIVEKDPVLLYIYKVSLTLSKFKNQPKHTLFLFVHTIT